MISDVRGPFYRQAYSFVWSSAMTGPELCMYHHDTTPVVSHTSMIRGFFDGRHHMFSSIRVKR